MEKSSKRFWRRQALHLINRYERGLLDDLSATSLADLCSISRTTLWRDAEVSKRLAEAKEHRSSARVFLASASPARLKLQRHSIRVQAIERENFKLIEAIAVIYLQLHELGMDPAGFIKPEGLGAEQLAALMRFMDDYWSQELPREG